MLRGEFDKSLEYFDKAICGSPYDPAQLYWYGGKAEDNFGLKRYDQAIELARKTIAIQSNYVPWANMFWAAALALTGHDAEAREALQRYLALPSTGPLAENDRGVEGARDVPGRRSTLCREGRTGVRRPPQGRDAGAMKATGGFAATSPPPASAVCPHGRGRGGVGAGIARMSGMASRSELLTTLREQPLSPMKPMRPSLESLHKIIFPTYACLCSLGVQCISELPPADGCFCWFAAHFLSSVAKIRASSLLFFPE